MEYVRGKHGHTDYAVTLFDCVLPIVARDLIS